MAEQSTSIRWLAYVLGNGAPDHHEQRSRLKDHVGLSGLEPGDSPDEDAIGVVVALTVPTGP